MNSCCFKPPSRSSVTVAAGNSYIPPKRKVLLQKNYRIRIEAQHPEVRSLSVPLTPSQRTTICVDIWPPGTGEVAPAPAHAGQAIGPDSSEWAASRAVFSDIPFPTMGGRRRARGGQGILPPLPTSFPDNRRLNAFDFGIKETSRILQNNSKEPSTVHNLPVVTKRLPFTRLGGAFGAGAGNSITSFWNVMKHSHHHSRWAGKCSGRARACCGVRKRKGKAYTWEASPRRAMSQSQPW